MQTLGNALRVSVICYDYEGYGCSDGQAKNGNFFRDLMNVYIFARQFYEGKNIFFFGDSSMWFLANVPLSWLCSDLPSWGISLERVSDEYWS